MCDCLSTKNVFRMLSCVRDDEKFFLRGDASYFCGLAKTKMNDLRKYLLREGFLQEKKREYFLAEKGEEFLSRVFDDKTMNEIKFGFVDVYEKTPVIISDALTQKKTPPTLSRAIRLLAKHLVEGEELKEHSPESFLHRELLGDSSTCLAIKADIEEFLLNSERVCLKDLFEKFFAAPYGLTRSLVAVLLLDVIVQNKDVLAIYEQHQFQLKFDVLMFDRMIFCPHNFEIQKTVVDDVPVLRKISKIILSSESSNILDLTKGIICFVKKLEKYTLNTERISKRTMRFRNAIMNAKDPVSLFYRDIPKVLCGKLLCQCDDSLVDAFAISCDELRGCYDNLVSEISNFFYSSFMAPDRKSLVERFCRVEEFLGDKDLKILHNNIKESNSSDQLWIERIATFVNKSRVPKDWSDEDVSDFKCKIKELSVKFLGIEAVASADSVLLKDKSVENILKNIADLSLSQKIAVLGYLVEQ